MFARIVFAIALWAWALHLANTLGHDPLGAFGAMLVFAFGIGVWFGPFTVRLLGRTIEFFPDKSA